MDDEHADDGRPDDESPPPPAPPRTPAEQAGATPLDAERFRAHGGAPVGQRHREIPGRISDEDDVAVEPVRRRRRRRGTQHPKRWLAAAAVCAVVGLGLAGVAVATEPDQEVATAGPAELVVATPVLSARRVPELTTRPVAVRNLGAAVQPVLDRLPPDSCVQVSDAGNALVARNDRAALVPASNQKVVTAAAALDLLGPDTRLSTAVLTDGAPTDGSVVRGNLYLVGGGDPLLSTETYLRQLPNGRQPATDLAALADRVVATGIREITGSVVGDGSRYDGVRTVEAWPDRFVAQGQVAPLSALVVDDAWSPVTGPGADPETHAAGVLTDLLRARGVTIAGAPAAGPAPPTASPLVELSSLPMAEIVAEGLRFSDNTTMELLVKEIGLEVSGTGSTAAGLDAIRAWMAERGLPTEAVVLDDGSGLSDRNRVTCALLSAVLADDGAEGPVAAGLARPGEPGTLDDRLLDPELRDRVRAKTGTLRSVTSLSGWLRTVPGADLNFAIVQNRPGGAVGADDAAVQRDLLLAMLGFPDRPALDQVAPLAPVDGGA